MGLDDIKKKFKLSHNQLVALVESLAGCVGFDSEPIVRAMDEIYDGGAAAY